MSTRERILHFVRTQPYSPTVAEIAREVGRSKSTVHVHLVALEREGLISRLGEERRIYPSERVA